MQSTPPRIYCFVSLETLKHKRQYAPLVFIKWLEVYVNLVDTIAHQAARHSNYCRNPKADGLSAPPHYGRATFVPVLLITGMFIIADNAAFKLC